jgi:hypothetical protein
MVNQEMELSCLTMLKYTTAHNMIPSKLLSDSNQTESKKVMFQTVSSEMVSEKVFKFLIQRMLS